VPSDDFDEFNRQVNMALYAEQRYFETLAELLSKLLNGK